MKSLLQKTITETSISELDAKCNEFGLQNEVRFTQSYAVVIDKEIFHTRILFYEDEVKEITCKEYENVYASEKEIGASWDEVPHSTFNTYGIKKASDGSFLNLDAKILTEEGRMLVTPWRDDGTRWELRPNHFYSKIKKTPKWKVYEVQK